MLRAYGLASRDFWTDEAGRIATAKQPLALLWADMFGHEQTPPLYYLLLRTVIAAAGDSLTSYRLLSFSAGVGTVWLVWWFSRDLFGGKAGIVSALLVATSPYFISLSQDANTYSVLGFVALLAIWRFWHAMHSDRARDWITCAVATVVALYVHHYFWLVVLFEAIYLAGRWAVRGEIPSRWYLGGGLCALLYLPYVPVAVRQFQAAQGKGYIGRSLFEYIRTLITSLFNIGSGYRLSEFEDVIRQGRGLVFEPRLAEVLLAAGVPAVLAFLGMLVLVRFHRSKALFLGLVFFGTLVVGSYSLFLSRHLVVVGALYFVIIAAGIASAPFKTHAIVLAMLLLVDALSLRSFYATPWSRTRPQDWHGAARRVFAGMQPGDVVVVNAWIGGAFAFSYDLWSLNPEIFEDIKGASQRALPGSVPPSWGRMAPKTKEGKVAYAWLVTPERRLVETTDPRYLSAHEESMRLRQMVCAQCRIWIVYDTWNQNGSPSVLSGLTAEMTPVLQEQRARYLRLLLLAPRDLGVSS